MEKKNPVAFRTNNTFERTQNQIKHKIVTGPGVRNGGESPVAYLREGVRLGSIVFKYRGRIIMLNLF